MTTKIANLFENQAFSVKKITNNLQLDFSEDPITEAEPGTEPPLKSQVTAQAEQPDYIDPDPLDWYELDSLSAKPPKKAPKTTKQPYSPRWKKGGRHYGQ